MDADGNGPASAYTIPHPDFTVRSLLMNVVLRWELRPGSTLFAVWQHRNGGEIATGDLSFARDANGLVSGPPDNVLALKVAYWFAR